MAFVKDESYWEYRYKAINEAIKGTEENLKKQTWEKAIEAHKAQIRSYKKEREKIRQELLKF